MEQLIEATRQVGEEVTPAADVIDLTDLLKRSLLSRGAAAPSPAAAAPKKATSSARSTKTAAHDALARERAAAAGKGSVKARTSVPASKSRKNVR